MSNEIPPAWNLKRRIDRDITMMLGLAKGVLLDGVVTDYEARQLHLWLNDRPHLHQQWPAKQLVTRLNQIFEDGTVDDGERRELKKLLSDLEGDKVIVDAGETASTLLPMDDPAPEVVLGDSTFLLTGKFVLGPRDACKSLIRGAGGSCVKQVTKKLDYLVVGVFGSRDWIHGSFGRKIEKAVKSRSEGVPIAIVSEERLAKALESL